MAITQVSTIAALEALTPSAGDCAYLSASGRAGMFVFDDNDLSAEVTADTAQGIYVAPDSDATGSSGAWARQAAEAEYLLQWFGGERNGTGAQNTAAITSAWNLLKSTGGRILLPPGRLFFNNSTFDPATSTVALVAHTSTILHPADPNAGTYMWNFLDGGSQTLVEFHNILVSGQQTPGLGQSSPRWSFNGIRVGCTNNLVLWNCKGRYVDGCAWNLIRNHNSFISLKTYRSGKADGSEWAFWMTGDSVTGEIFNDVAFGNECASEKDFHGWLIEGGTRVRMPLIKLHGANESGGVLDARDVGIGQRAFQVHRVVEFIIAVQTSSGYTGNGFIHISDAGGGDGVVFKQPGISATDQTRGCIFLDNKRNTQVMDDSGVTLDLMTIDLGNSSSDMIVEGVLRPQSTPLGTSDYRLIGLASPGASGARIDLVGITYTGEDISKVVDDRRSASKKRNVARVASPALLVESNFKATGGSTRVAGETVAISFPGDSHQPPARMVGLAYDTGDEGTRLINPYEVVSGQVHSSISATTQIIMSRKLVVPVDSSGTEVDAYLRRVQISAGAGLASSHDPANHWALDIYKSSGINQTLKLSRGTLTSAAGDGFPNKVSGNTINGYYMDYWDGLIELDAGRANYVSAILRPVGSPPAITGCQVTLYFEASE